MADHNDSQAKGTTSSANDGIANHKTINKESTGKFMFQNKNVNIDVIAVFIRYCHWVKMLQFFYRN